MRYFKFALLLIFALVLLSACQSSGATPIPPTPAPQWQTFHSDEGGFSVQFPAPPEKNISSSNLSYNGIYTSTYQGMTFNAAFSIMSGGSNQLPTEKLLETVRDSHAEELKAKILSSDPIELNGYPGLAYSLDAPDSKTLPGGGVVQARVYLADNRLYAIYHSGPKKNSLSADVKKYLNSLKVDGMVEVPTPAPAVAGPATGPEGWEEFVAQKDGFSVFLPEKPERKVAVNNKTMEGINYLAQSGLDTYGVMSFNLKDPALSKSRPDPLFDIVKESLFKSTAGTVVSEKPIQLGPYAGKEIQLHLPKSKDQPTEGQMLVRLYLANTHIYGVLAMTLGKDTPPEVTQFLDSFKVLDSK